MQEERFFIPGIPYRNSGNSGGSSDRNLRRLTMRIGIAGAIFASGVIGLILNAAYTLRAALGALFLLAFLRYPYLLLIAWALISVFVGSTVSFFNGNNFDTGLTVATFLLMTTVPFTASLRRMPALTLLGLFLLWVLAGIGVSPLDTGTFLTRWLISVDFLGVSVLVMNLLTTKRLLHRLIDAILLVTTFISAYGVYGFFTKQNGVADAAVPVLFRSGSIFGDVAPSLAFFLCIIIPLAIYRTLTSDRLKRVIYLLVTLVSLASLVLTFTRTVFISFPLSIVIVIPLLPSRKLRAYLLSGAFALAALMIVLAVGLGLPIFDRFFNGDVTSLNGRTYLWQGLLSHFHPTQVLGNGLGASDILLTRLRIGYGGVIDTAPHNFLLGTLYDHGIIGMLLLLLTFVLLFVTLVKHISRASGDYRVLLLMALVAWINVFIMSLDSNELWSQASALYFWIVMALPFASCWPATQNSSWANQASLHDEAEVRHAGVS
jgi:O-antigen ligase